MNTSERSIQNRIQNTNQVAPSNQTGHKIEVSMNSETNQLLGPHQPNSEQLNQHPEAENQNSPKTVSSAQPQQGEGVRAEDQKINWDKTLRSMIKDSWKVNKIKQYEEVVIKAMNSHKAEREIEYKPHQQIINFSYSNHILAAGSKNSLIYLNTINDDSITKEEKQIKGHNTEMSCLEVSHCGRFVFSSSKNKQLLISKLTENGPEVFYPSEENDDKQEHTLFKKLLSFKISAEKCLLVGLEANSGCLKMKLFDLIDEKRNQDQEVNLSQKLGLEGKKVIDIQSTSDSSSRKVLGLLLESGDAEKNQFIWVYRLQEVVDPEFVKVVSVNLQDPILMFRVTEELKIATLRENQENGELQIKISPGRNGIKSIQSEQNEIKFSEIRINNDTKEEKDQKEVKPKNPNQQNDNCPTQPLINLTRTGQKVILYNDRDNTIRIYQQEDFREGSGYKEKTKHRIQLTSHVLQTELIEYDQFLICLLKQDNLLKIYDIDPKNKHGLKTSKTRSNLGGEMRAESIKKHFENRNLIYIHQRATRTAKTSSASQRPTSPS